jgi:hypothetical protein
MGCSISPQSQWYHPEKSPAEQMGDENACKEYVEAFAPHTSETAKYVYKEKEMKRCMQRKGYVWQDKRPVVDT